MDNFQSGFLKTIIERTFKELKLYHDSNPTLQSIGLNDITRLANDDLAKVKEWILDLDKDLSRNLPPKIISLTKQAILYLETTDYIQIQKERLSDHQLGGFVLMLLQREYYKHLIEITKIMIESYLDLDLIRTNENPFYEKQFDDSTIMRAYAAFMRAEEQERNDIEYLLKKIGVKSLDRKFGACIKDIELNRIKKKLLQNVIDYIELNDTISKRTTRYVMDLIKENSVD